MVSINAGHRNHRFGRCATNQPSIWIGEGTVTSFSPKINITNLIRSELPEINKEESRWYIDESGTPFLSQKSKSDYIVLSAVTPLSAIDFRTLFGQMPLENKNGHSFIHFTYLLDTDNKNHTSNALEICRRIGNLGKEKVLIIQYPVDKKSYMNTGISPTDLYRESVSRLIDVIPVVDISKRICVTMGESTYIRDVNELSFNNVDVRFNKPYKDYGLSLADICASSYGKALNTTGRNYPPNPVYYASGVSSVSMEILGDGYLYNNRDVSTRTSTSNKQIKEYPKPKTVTRSHCQHQSVSDSCTNANKNKKPSTKKRKQKS